MLRSAPEQSFESTNFVRLSHLRKLRECALVAAVCYRKRRGDIEFLLVQTRGGDRWTFPKGSTEPGLTHAQAAALEAFEEAGVHGRIEEAAFTQYTVRRRSDTRRPGARSLSEELCVNAHLCAVSRLGAPQESGRNRTWFSVQDARQALRENRSAGEGAAFARVIEKAIRHIRRTHDRDERVGDPPAAYRNRDDQPPSHAMQKDPLQCVQLEPSERNEYTASLARYMRRPGNMERSSTVITDVYPPQVLQAEILQFGLPHGKKTKVLGNGIRRFPTLAP